MTNIDNEIKIEENAVKEEKINMKNIKKTLRSKRAISLIALIITIIVIIILSIIVISAASNAPEEANKARFLADISQIQQAVGIKRTTNLIPSVDNIEGDMNAGFKKIKIKKTENSDPEDGWVVDLEKIGIKNSTLGKGYNAVVEDSVITFGTNAPDIYVYDEAGDVYYSRGVKAGDDIIYSQSYIISQNGGEEEEEEEGPIEVVSRNFRTLGF